MSFIPNNYAVQHLRDRLEIVKSRIEISTDRISIGKPYQQLLKERNDIEGAIQTLKILDDLGSLKEYDFNL